MLLFDFVYLEFHTWRRRSILCSKFARYENKNTDGNSKNKCISVYLSYTDKS